MEDACEADIDGLVTAFGLLDQAAAIFEAVHRDTACEEFKAFLARNVAAWELQRDME